MFFPLIQARLEDALLVYSNMIDEPIEVDPALETLTEPCITVHPFPSPTHEEGLEEIEQELLKRLGVVIRRRKGKVIAQLKSGPTKRPAGQRPVHKPLHDVVIEVSPRGLQYCGLGRWPGEQSRKALKDGSLQLNLQVPNLDPPHRWLLGLMGEAFPVEPKELQEMLLASARRMLEGRE